jgi:hypothetical protein
MKKQYLKKTIAVFCIYLMISLTFVIALSFAPINEDTKKKILDSIDIIPNAAATDTCVVSFDGRTFCNETIPRDQCHTFVEGKAKEDATINGVKVCTPGVCVYTAGGKCGEGITKAECEQGNIGVWYADIASAPAACQLGCCVMPNKASCYNNVYENSECTSMGYTPSGQKTNQQCQAICDPITYGCCKDTYTNKFSTECDPSNFVSGVYCSLIPGPVTACKYIGKGGTGANPKQCYCYDSKSVREGIVTATNNVNHTRADGTTFIGGACSSTETCKDYDGVGGKNATCRSTNCIDSCPKCSKVNFKEGESVCLNVAPGFFNPGSRSSYLKNFRLICDDGDIVPDSTFDDGTRSFLCVDTTENNLSTAKKVSNGQDACRHCGNGETWDVLGYMPLIGPMLGTVLGGETSMCRGRSSTDDVNFWGRGEKCDDVGRNNQYGIKMCDGGNGDYDYDFWGPIGSCNPVYPPGTKNQANEASACNECGRGGDPMTNVCTEEECNHMGDCQFTPDPLASSGFQTMALTALGGLGTAYLICKVTPYISQTLACEEAVVSIAEGMISLSPSLLYWGIWALVFGIGASYNAEVKETKMQLINEKVPIANVITTKMSLDKKGYERAGQAFTGVAYAAVAEVLLAWASSNLGLIDIWLSYYTTGALGNIYLGSSTTAAAAWVGYALSAVGILTMSYFASRAMNTGSCAPEQPMTVDEKQTYYGDYANETCESCGWGEGQPWCTEKRCQILGVNCNWIRNTSITQENGKCITVPQDDFNPPLLTSLRVEYYNTNDTPSIGYNSNVPKILRPEANILPYTMTFVKIYANTSERAQCKFSAIPRQNISSMSYILQGVSYDFQNEYLYPIEHETGFVPIDRSTLPATLNFYIKCKDLNGNSQSGLDIDTYSITFSVQEGPDTAPPEQAFFTPTGSVSYTNNSFELRVLLRDRSGVDSCVYLNKSNNYSKMSRLGSPKSVSCYPTYDTNDCDLFNATIRMKPSPIINCSDYGVDLASINAIDNAGNATHYVLTQNELNIYNQQKAEYAGTKICHLSVVCNDTVGNVKEINTSVFTSPAFNISMNFPDPSYERKPRILVETNRSSWCNYTISGKSFDFNDPADGSQFHSIQHLEDLAIGTYTVRAICHDLFRTIASISKQITITGDNTDPSIVRAYKEEGNIHLVTNKNAICVSVANCNTAYSEGEKMETIAKLDHYALWENDKTFYVRCLGEWQTSTSALGTSSCTTIKPFQVQGGATTRIIGGFYKHKVE